MSDVTLALSQNRETVIDEVDMATIAPFHWYALRMNGRYWYTCAKSRDADGKRIVLLMHRLILAAPAGMVVDHISGDGLDNRRANLRLATRGQNRMNSGPSPGNKSGYKGVYWKAAHKSWEVQIRHEGRLYCVGHFKQVEDAARAYDKRARELQGAFAYANFPQDMRGDR